MNVRGFLFLSCRNAGLYVFHTLVGLLRGKVTLVYFLSFMTRKSILINKTIIGMFFRAS